FDVHVTGTRFELGWDPSNEMVDLRLDEGSVEVRGPLGEAPIAVRAGQRFRADLASRSMTVSDVANESARALTPPASERPSAPTAAEPTRAANAPTSEPNPDAPAPPTEPRAIEATPPHVAPSSPAEPWSALVARGQFETVVAKATEHGTRNCEATCSAADLRALADAARYTGRSAMAEGALDAVRNRFGTTKEGRSASFLLGRLAEARGDERTAERWYDTYLRELPGGALSAEALAGKMRAELASSGPAAAKPVAEKYLSLYPNGVHAETARGIVAGRGKP
ncbi:MAG TPA: hypothetical protein VGQ57_07355, partial [Polyangiaceae bacterium]|nr:hypothetical protein [Polyangiaceae bacterium]